jgi:hypothetical protein
MIGRSLPVTGAETRMCRSTARPGAGSTTGLIEKTGAGALMVSGDSVCALMTFDPFRGLEFRLRSKRSNVPELYGTVFRFVKSESSLR